MKPFYQDKWVTIYHGDCREPTFANVSAIVTDPPYELGFMGKSWDSKGVSFQKETWQVIRNACKSGAPLLSFGGTRTFHRIACAIEDAGWEIRDTLMWVYGQGFPKSLDISKAIDRHGGTNEQFNEIRNWLRSKVKECGLKYKDIDTALGNENSHKASHYLDNSQPQIPTPEDWAILKTLLGVSEEIDHPPRYKEFEREVIGKHPQPAKSIYGSGKMSKDVDITTPATPEAQLWEGYGTALKPAYEPIILAMNPLDGTFANNALKHGVAGLNIDQCRIPTEDNLNGGAYAGGIRPTSAMGQIGEAGGTSSVFEQGTPRLLPSDYKQPQGRFPANFIHDGSQMVLELFPETKSGTGAIKRKSSAGYQGNAYGSESRLEGTPMIEYGDNGSAARFFYCAKASKAERDRGCEDMPEQDVAYSEYREAMKTTNSYVSKYPDGSLRPMNKIRNNHPTVKPLALMEYLVKLVKMPEYNLIIDPFMGSGTTLLACIRLGIPCIGIDNDEKACEIAARRCSQEVMDFSIPTGMQG